MFQVAAGCRSALVVGDIGNRQSRRDYAETAVKGSELTQQRLKRRVTNAPFLRTRGKLQRFKAVQYQQGSTVRDQICQSLSFLPGSSDPWIGISEPIQGRIDKLVSGRNFAAAALSVK